MEDQENIHQKIRKFAREQSFLISCFTGRWREKTNVQNSFKEPAELYILPLRYDVICTFFEYSMFKRVTLRDYKVIRSHLLTYQFYDTFLVTYLNYEYNLMTHMRFYSNDEVDISFVSEICNEYSQV